jgi:hypothetical protein
MNKRVIKRLKRSIRSLSEVLAGEEGEMITQDDIDDAAKRIWDAQKAMCLCINDLEKQERTVVSK